MHTAKQLRERGWRFSYCDKMRFVTAVHPKGGGRFRVMDIVAPERHLSESERQALGAKIVGLLNGCQCRRFDDGLVEREWACPIHGSEL